VSERGAIATRSSATCVDDPVAIAPGSDTMGLTMKTCPNCKRNYTDDLSFCLEDGVRLVPANASQQTPDQEKTAILPGGMRPTAEPVSVRQTAIEGSAPAYSHQPPQSPEKRGGKLWLIVGGGVAIVFIGFVALAGFFVWKASNNSNANSSQAASNGPNQNPNDAAANNDNRNSQSETAETPNLEWLSGVWTGDGYQTDTKTRWEVKLTVRDDTYSIDYPDILCKGTWKLIEKNSRSASFSEVITQGIDQCTNSHVTVEKLSASEISCRYTHLKSRAVIATAVLTKKEW
jgi:hypothetical protein